ncbi:hypothetical protein VNO78_24909 [Psophocarpus tetragonolobus]|uniref:Uncharacterized protein n=1 Tax=Psophocarpus tetragonolobus TaxID=3891 RepID=A0AAN9XEZ7_PSOTE
MEKVRPNEKNPGHCEIQSRNYGPGKKYKPWPNNNEPLLIIDDNEEDTHNTPPLQPYSKPLLQQPNYSLESIPSINARLGVLDSGKSHDKYVEATILPDITRWDSF